MMFSLPLLLKNRPRQDGLPQGSAEALPAPVADPLARFRTTKEHAITLGDALLSVLTDNLRQGDPGLLDEIWRLLPFYIDVVATADFAAAAATDVSPPSREESVPTIPEYLTTSIFLSTCLSYLLASTQQGKERINLVTGAKKGGSLRTLDRLGKVALAQQSLVGATADQRDLLKCLRELDGFGLHLHGLFHCHPGTGPAMTRPSATDLATQERFERGGYPCIGGICSRDGWFRLFAHHPFTITVFGKGVVQHEEHLFHIQEYPSCLSQQPLEEEEGGGISHDSARGSAWV
jgi:hypothetical protein